MIDEIKINNTTIVPGQNATIKIDVAKLPSGTDIHLNIHVFRSRQPGPTMLVMGGMHGDEVNGVEIVRRMLEQELFENLSHGNVIAIPLLNIYGFINFSRDLPDGKDVNRSFPGYENGSLASRVAYTFTSEILPLIDFGVDYHTGGSSRFNYPQIRFSPKDNHAEEIAKAFAAPYVLHSNPIDKSLRKEAAKKEKSIVVYEGGESLRMDNRAIQEGIDGMKRLMLYKGFTKEPAPFPKEPPKLFAKKSWLRATRSGLFRWYKGSGQSVIQGEEIGVINDPDGQTAIPVLAHFTGHIVGHSNAPVVNQGDALFHIAYLEE